MPRVSIIIPAYNSSRYLAEAIDSVLAQTFQDFEIIIVDDGSTDGTLQVARNYPQLLRVVSQQRLGPSAARNAGIQVSKGEYLVFLDADDLLLPSKLEAQVFYLDDHSEVDVVYSNGYCFWAADNGSEIRIPFSNQGLLHPHLGQPEESLPVLAIQNAFPIHAALVRLPAIEHVGGFDQALFGREDWDLWLRVAESHRFAYLDKYVALYRQATAGVSDQFDDQAQAVRVIGGKVESRAWFQGLPADVRSDFYFCWGVQELEYRQTQAAKNRFRSAIVCDPGNYLARAALLSVQAFGNRALRLYHLKRRYLGARSPKLATSP